MSNIQILVDGLVRPHTMVAALNLPLINKGVIISDLFHKTIVEGIQHINHDSGPAASWEKKYMFYKTLIPKVSDSEIISKFSRSDSFSEEEIYANGLFFVKSLEADFHKFFDFSKKFTINLGWISDKTDENEAELVPFMKVDITGEIFFDCRHLGRCTEGTYGVL